MKTWLAVAIFLLTGALSSGSIGFLEEDEVDRFEEFFRDEILDSLDTGEAGPFLTQIFRDLEVAERLETNPSEWQEIPETYDPLYCNLCNVAVDVVLNAIENGTDLDVIAGVLIDLCVDVGLANLNFCENFVHDVQDQLFWVVMNRANLTGEDFCGMFFGILGCETNNPERIWEVPLPDENKPPVVDPVVPPEGSPVMKVLHLSDTHYDPYYLPGSNAECGERFYCCRAESGPVETPEAAAGKWGDYRGCDAPQWLLQAMYDHIKATHQDIDFILWTGDLIPHNIWNTSREGNLQIIRDCVQMIADNFPGIPVFPAIGNHESHPVAAFPQPYIDNEFDISWLYDEITSLWATWLPPDVAASVAYAAYYSTLIKPGLRILSLNSNYCYGLNWWLIYDDVDPASELDWMAKELDAAETAGEKVYLMAHIPPGNSDCTRTWSHEYNRIVFRYESTIAGLFFGHNHQDQFMLFYDPVETTRPYHVAYVAQSQTPYTNLNPGYKVYSIDGDYEGSSYRVLDHENWILDLDEANELDEARFFHLYTAKEAYNNYVKAARPQLEEGCDDTCKSRVLCRLMVADSSDRSQCDDL